MPGTSSSSSSDCGTLGYGWLGTKQRSTTTDTAGLTLMGDRLYNPVTGTFTSTDPEPGGNTTTYTYPQDPINGFDLQGHSWLSRVGGHFKRHWKTYAVAALTVASFAACGICTGIGYAMMAYSAGSAGYHAYKRNYREALWDATGVLGGGWARGARWASARNAKRAAKIWRSRRGASKAVRRQLRSASRHYTRKAARWERRSHWSRNIDLATFGPSTAHSYASEW
jgi:large repetitive protein